MKHPNSYKFKTIVVVVGVVVLVDDVVVFACDVVDVGKTAPDKKKMSFTQARLK